MGLHSWFGFSVGLFLLFFFFLVFFSSQVLKAHCRVLVVALCKNHQKCFLPDLLFVFCLCLIWPKKQLIMPMFYFSFKFSIFGENCSAVCKKDINIQKEDKWRKEKMSWHQTSFWSSQLKLSQVRFLSPTTQRNLTLPYTYPTELLSLIHCSFYVSTRKLVLYKLFSILTTHVSVPKSPHVYTKNISLHGLFWEKWNWIISWCTIAKVFEIDV